MKNFLIGLTLGIVLITIALSGAIADRIFDFSFLNKISSGNNQNFRVGLDQKILNEESIVIDVAEAASPSVVTVSIKTPQQRVLEFSPFGGFSQRFEGGQEQDIGSGFIVSEDGLIVTNKHVVSSEGTYKVIDKEGREYDVQEINKDPSNDIAIIKINASGLKPIELGDSDNLKVGQFAIAIGTALGEFRHTVTTGVISGLGRGITAGSAFEGYVERIDDVIQTDAAINPGNSGGPLLNSAGQVIGINVAVAQGAQNVGFAIPINVVKKGLEQFQSTGKFASKPYLGVQYQMISKKTAVMNDLPEGAFVAEVVEGSPAENAGIQADDIITKFDGNDVSEKEKDLAELIASKKPGDEVEIEIYRNQEVKKIKLRLSEFQQ